jgi:TonB family protein
MTAVFCGPSTLLAQDRNSTPAQSQVVVTDLAAPIYPPLARQTYITGDVEVELELSSDGGVQSLNVVKGHVLLGQAAADDARRSEFECRNWADRTVSYRMIFTFQIVDGDACCTESKSTEDTTPELPFPRITQSGNHVTVQERVFCICDPSGELGKVRSLKCLFLWRCGRIIFTDPHGNHQAW